MSVIAIKLLKSGTIRAVFIRFWKTSDCKDKFVGDDKIELLIVYGR